MAFRHARTGILAGVLLCYTPDPVSATTWVVDPGGGGHATTVGGGLLLASPGDTVLVRPGTYYESLAMRDGVILRSADGPELTVLHGSDLHPVLWCAAVGPGSAIEGFTITHALGDSIGGGIVCLEGSSPRITGNHIVANRSFGGAAVGCTAGSSPIVEDNLIADNVATYGPGGVWGFDQCDLVVRRNVFRNNRAIAAGGGAMSFGDDCSPTVLDNLVLDNECAEGGAGIWLGWGPGETAIVRGNVFARNHAGLVGGGVYAGAVGTVLMDHNTFEANSAVQRGGAIMFQPDVCVTFAHNIVSHTTGGGAAVEARCGLADCNDFWMNPGGDYLGISPGAHDLFLDPLLCDSARDDFTLADTSPCADAPSCGRVGARDVGCGAVSSIPLTWGRTKTRFR